MSDSKLNESLQSMAKQLINKIDTTQILNSRMLADDTKKIRISDIRKELHNLLLQVKDT